MNRVLRCLLLMTIAVAGCESQSDRNVTSTVKGQVVVDGNPAAGIQVQLIATNGAPATSVSAAMTTEQGSFEISTYEQGDGAPAGEYSATFTWRELAVMNQGADMPDKLKDRYSNPQSSTFKVKVESGKPVDMGKIELKTK